MRSFIADDGETIHVRVTGHGPPVVLVHQWAADHTVWGEIPLALSGEFTVYCWDARGHGSHPRTPEVFPPLVGRMARDLRNLIEFFRLDRPLVVGHSMGALTLWEFIGRYGCGRLGKVCFIDQSPRLLTDEQWQFGIYGDFSSQRNAAFIDSMRRDFPETVLRLVADGKNPRATMQYQSQSRGMQKLREALAKLDSEPLITCWESLLEADYRAVLPEISIPTLLIYGSLSNYYSAETANWVNQAIPGSVLYFYDNADHSPHQAYPERFVHDLRVFAHN
ncbi:Alpha/beta hydrolase [uncultured Gammaproteobacteria bacterium]